VLVTHAMGTVEERCDRAGLLLHGRLVAEGAPKDVIERYQETLDPAAAGLLSR